MNQLDVRLAKREDYLRILDLESKNYIDNVPEAERRDGFLSARMTEEQVDRIAREVGIAVAYEGDELVGFFCVSRPEHWPSDSIVHRLVHYLTKDLCDERLADPEGFCIYGPMCCSPTARGTGILGKMYDTVTASLGERYGAGAGFISTKNPRSLAAVAKLDWHPAGRFSRGDREYYALVRDIDRPERAARASVASVAQASAVHVA
ncbi:MAG TPA: acetyltransferase [Candidatus Angelobacter sp.]|nr:acetyltransferase [Candidatus Angelobacter sp.]